MAINYWIVSTVFLSAGAITNSLNRLARVLAGEKERERRANVGTNCLIGGSAFVSLLVVMVFGLIFGSACGDAKKARSPSYPSGIELPDGSG